MTAVLVDSNVILDVFEDDERWANWSESMLDQYADSYTLAINPVIYAEVSVGFARIEELEEALTECRFSFLLIPKEALFLAGKAFVTYRR